MPKLTMRLILALAVVSGLVVALGIYRIIASADSARARQGDSGPIVVARSTLGRGTVLTESHLQVVARPRSEFLPGSFTELRSVVGRVVVEPISTGAPLLESSLAPSGKPLLGHVVPDGYRAVGVFLDPRGGIQRFLRAGDRVDVVATVEDEEGISSSKLLLQDVQVLGVPETAGQLADRGGNEEWVPVTLAVTSTDAERLALTMHVGTVQLLVRGYDDRRQVQTSGVTRDTLLPVNSSRGAASAVTGEIRSYDLVEVLRGQERRRERFRQPGAPSPVVAVGSRDRRTASPDDGVNE